MPANEVISGGDNRVLTGKAAYEGLTAWVHTPFDGESAQGFIIEAEPME